MVDAENIWSSGVSFLMRADWERRARHVLVRMKRSRCFLYDNLCGRRRVDSGESLLKGSLS